MCVYILVNTHTQTQIYSHTLKQPLTPIPPIFQHTLICTQINTALTPTYSVSLQLSSPFLVKPVYFSGVEFFPHTDSQY